MISLKKEPHRIRRPDGSVPMLTPAQRARIVTVDLDNPPPFIGVLKRLEDVRRIVEQPESVEEAWIHRPNWGASQNIFDRRQPFPANHGIYGLLNSYGRVDIADTERETVIGLLSTPVAALFVDNLRGICLRALDCLPGCNYAYMGIDFERQAVPSDLHIDLQSLRGFMALEHGNVVLPDMAAARAAGFTFTSTTNAANNPWELVDLIEAGVPVYSAGFSDITFMRGNMLQGGPTWHAAYPKNPTISCDRPTIKMDFTFG